MVPTIFFFQGQSNSMTLVKKILSSVWVLKGIRVFNLEQDSRMKRDFCLKQSQVLRASTELPRDPLWSVSGMLSITTLPIAIN